MNESKHLGKNTAYPKHYDPTVLVAVPRQKNRGIYGIEEGCLPFTGVDIWHAYEVGFLTRKGLPVTGLLKLAYSCESPFLIESKSLKLYLNSFNMEPFGETPEESAEMVLGIIRHDLEATLRTQVNLTLYREGTPWKHDFHHYQIIEDIPGIEHQTFEEYTEKPELLMPGKNTGEEIKLGTHLLRSNCKVTHQPDWGSAFICLKGAEVPDKFGVVKYLVSLRNETHFHEEICEMVYKRLWDRFSPEKLMVACIYTRRGGIDICPVRASHPELFPENLTDVEKLSGKLLRQ